MLLMLEAGFLLISLFVALYYKGDDVKPLFICSIITFFIGAILRFPLFKQQKIKIDRRLGFLIVSLIWVIMSAFGALPYYIGGYTSYTDAYFETMSGFTTTGASVLPDVEILPKGLMFWRCLTNGIGGIGIVVIVISFIPFIGGGGMALYAAEVAGPDKGKLSPQIRKTGFIVLTIYIILILLSTLCLWASGMSLYDASCHSFSCLASGGFSTKNLSGAAFSPLIQYLLILSMIPSGINFTLMYYAIKGRYKRIWINEEFKIYFAIIIIASLIITLFIYNPSNGLEPAIRSALFQVVSVITSTGLVNDDYTLWATPAIFVLFILMFSGAMSGSTTGGLKLVRVIVLFKNAKNIIKHRMHLKAFIPIKFSGKVVSQQMISNILAMFFLFIFTYVVGVMLLLAFGEGFIESTGGSVSCISNMGPGYGSCGGFKNFSTFSDLSKWVCSILMYVGRLEIITVFCLFMPAFWKK